MAGSLVAVASLFAPNYYKSEATVLPVDTNAGGMGGIAAAAAAFGIGLGGQGSGDANWPDILTSRWMKESLLNTEFKFHVRPHRFGSERSCMETLFQHLEQKDMDHAVNRLEHLYVVNRDIKSNVITISMESKSPDLSQQVVRRATALLEQFVLHMSRTRSGEKATFAADRLAEARTQMAKAEDAFRNFLEVNRNYQSSNDPGVRLRGDRLEGELKLYQNLVNTLAMNREQSLLDAKNDVPVVNVLDPGNYPLEKSWPSRSSWVLAAFLLAALGHLSWDERAWIKTNLLDGASGA